MEGQCNRCGVHQAGVWSSVGRHSFTSFTRLLPRSPRKYLTAEGRPGSEICLGSQEWSQPTGPRPFLEDLQSLGCCVTCSESNLVKVKVCHLYSASSELLHFWSAQHGSHSFLHCKYTMPPLPVTGKRNRIRTGAADNYGSSRCRGIGHLSKVQLVYGGLQTGSDWWHWHGREYRPKQTKAYNVSTLIKVNTHLAIDKNLVETALYNNISRYSRQYPVVH